MRLIRPLPVLALVVTISACETSVELASLMGSLDETGFAIISCEMIEKDNVFLGPDKIKNVSIQHCQIVKDGGRTSSAQVAMGYFVFPNLEPGLYCIESIRGSLTNVLDTSPGIATEEHFYTYRFPVWNIRELIFEITAGAPTYCGKIIITEPYDEYGGERRETVVKRIGEKTVKIDSDPGYEEMAWRVFLSHYPDSPWSNAVRNRLTRVPRKASEK